MANDHYVPQCLLRSFGTKRKKRTYVHVYDKWEQKSFLTNVSNILAENRFNEFEVDDSGEVISVEGNLAKLEGLAAPVLGKIRQKQNLHCLSDEEKAILLVFVAVQLTRTKHARNAFQQINDLIVERILEDGGDPNAIENFRPYQSENELKATSIVAMFSSLKPYTTALGDKVAFLLAAPDESPLYISDHPVVMANQNDFGVRGNIGLGVKGIEIYMPLSPKLLLAFYCQSSANEIFERWDQLKRQLADWKALSVLGVGATALEAKRNLEKFGDKEQSLTQFIDVMRNGECLAACPDNVMYFNDLQTRWSSRYIVSYTGDFSLAKQVLANFPDATHGYKFEDGAKAFKRRAET